jgi:hypothetical protein
VNKGCRTATASSALRDPSRFTLFHVIAVACVAAESQRAPLLTR